jgi:hypothetical protein
MYIGPWQEFKLARILQLKDKLEKEQAEENRYEQRQPLKALSEVNRLNSFAASGNDNVSDYSRMSLPQGSHVGTQSLSRARDRQIEFLSA